MLRSCLNAIVVFVITLAALIVRSDRVFATHQCGNGTCQPTGHHDETCSTCPADCGVCPVPTPTPDPSPTSTSSPTTTSSESNSQSVTYYPSVNLTSYAPDPTNRTSLTFSGSVAIGQGSVANVEYTVTDGAQWLSASASDGNYNSSNESFSFTTPTLFEGVHVIKVRAKSAAGVTTQAESYGSDTVTIITTPPSVIVDTISPNPTKNTQPELKGSAISRLGLVTQIDVSLDGGQTFLPAVLTGTRFTLKTEKLEDGNYEVIVRAFDNAGNVGRSTPQTLIIDTIPPIIGGAEQSIGPQVLTSDNNDYISLVVGVETTIAVSMRGGATEATINSGDNFFPLTRVPNSNIWVGKITPDKGGIKRLSITAIDGAGNKTERLLNTVKVEEFGRVVDIKSQGQVENAKITAFFFENLSQRWIAWEAASYGQTNPQQTTQSEGYSFILPPGKYYLEVGAPGFNTAQSEIFELFKTTVVNYPLQLISRPKIELKLPILGNIVLSLPQLTPPDSIPIMTQMPEAPLLMAIIDLQSQPGSEKLNLLDLEDKEVKLESFRGSKLLLSFISPWSSLSQEQAPFLTETSSALLGNQEMLVVILQEGTLTTQAYMKRGSHAFPVAADKDGVSANIYNVTLLPYHVFIDANGKIQSTHAGVLNKNELLKYLNDVQ